MPTTNPIDLNGYTLNTQTRSFISVLSKAALVKTFSSNRTSFTDVIKLILPTILSRSQIVNRQQKPISSRTKIVRVYESKSAVQVTYRSNIQSDSRIVKDYRKTLTSQGTVIKTILRTISSNSFVFQRHLTTIGAKADIISKGSKSIKSSALIVNVWLDAYSVNYASRVWSNLLSKSRIFFTGKSSITSYTDLVKAQSKNITSKYNIANRDFVSITSKSSISYNGPVSKITKASVVKATANSLSASTTIVKARFASVTTKISLVKTFSSTKSSAFSVSNIFLDAYTLNTNNRSWSSRLNKSTVINSVTKSIGAAFDIGDKRQKLSRAQILQTVLKSRLSKTSIGLTSTKSLNSSAFIFEPTKTTSTNGYSVYWASRSFYNITTLSRIIKGNYYSVSSKTDVLATVRQSTLSRSAITRSISSRAYILLNSPGIFRYDDALFARYDAASYDGAIESIQSKATIGVYGIVKALLSKSSIQKTLLPSSLLSKTRLYITPVSSISASSYISPASPSFYLERKRNFLFTFGLLKRSEKQKYAQFDVNLDQAFKAFLAQGLSTRTNYCKETAFKFEVIPKRRFKAFDFGTLPRKLNNAPYFVFQPWRRLR